MHRAQQIALEEYIHAIEQIEERRGRLTQQMLALLPTNWSRWAARCSLDMSPAGRVMNLDGVNSDGPSNNLLPPMSAVAANPSAVYVADARGVLQLSGTNGENSQAWSEVRPFMAPGTVPVLPG